MRTWTQTHYEGTEIGPVDYSHPMIAESGFPVDQLRRMEADPSKFKATNDGGVPRVGIHRVLTFCMYDGWPYWQPHPAVMTEGVLGPEWHSLRSLTDIYEEAK